MRKRFLVLVLLAALVSPVVFSGGGGDRQPASSGGKTDVTVWMGSWWEPAVPGIKADFEAAYPQYNLQIEVFPMVGYTDNASAAILAGSPPDVLDMNTLLPVFAARNLLTDITATVGAKINEADFISTSWKLCLYNGKLYGMPSRGAGNVYYYNKAIFDEAGVPYPTNAWTYDDMLNIARKLTVPGRRYGLGVAADLSNPGNVWESFVPAYFYYGADFFNEDETLCLMNTPEAVKAITWWTELYTRWKVVPEGTLNYNVSRDLYPLFHNGQIAMFAHNIDGIKAFTADPALKWGMVQLPGGVSRVVGWGLTNPVGSPNKQGAVDFMIWYAQAAVQAKHNVVEPANIAAWDMGPPWTDANYKQLMESGKSAPKMLPTLEVWADAEKIIVTELQLIMEKRKTPEQGANDMTAQINALIKK